MFQFLKSRRSAPTSDRIRDFLLQITAGEAQIRVDGGVVVLCDPKQEPLLTFRVYNSTVMVSVSYDVDSVAVLAVLGPFGREFDWEFDTGFILNAQGTKLTGQSAAHFHYERETKKSLAAQNFEALLPTNRGVRKQDLH